MTETNKVNVLNEAHGDNWSIYNADCVSGMKAMPDARSNATRMANERR